MTQPQERPPVASRGEDSWGPVLVYPLACLGALVGAGVGVLVLKLGLSAGFYVELAIGALAGFGASALARRGGWPAGIIAGVVTVIVGVWAEWKFVGPMVVDDSFGYFVRHFAELPTFKLLIHAIGVALAVWIGARR